MSEPSDNTVPRALIVGVLMIATLGFGLAGLCGAAFTAIGTIGMFEPGPENFSAAILVISVPSLLIGGGLALLCGFKLAKRFKDDA